MSTLSPEAEHARGTLRLLITFGLILVVIGVFFAGLGINADTTEDDQTPWIGLGIGLGVLGQLMLLVGVIGTGVRLGVEASDRGAPVATTEPPPA